MKRIFPLLLLVFLVSCQSAFFTDLVTASGQALYWDDFSDPSSGWRQASDVDGSLGYADGAYRFQVQTANHILWAVSGQAFRDVQVEADATLLEGPPANLFGLVCRSQDADDFYFFTISSDGYYAIGKIKQGAIALLGQEKMLYSPAIPQGSATIHLSFDCVGPVLTGYVNGQQISTVRDADFIHGDAGLIAGALEQVGVEISFDNFMVIKP